MVLYAFDGTGDRWDRKTTITPRATVKNGFFPGRRFLTNVVFIYKEYRDSGMEAEYFSGVGSSGLVLDTIFGGAFGVGTRMIAKRAFNKLQDNFRRGEKEIDIVGYSRGAASARIFAHIIYNRFGEITNDKGKKLNKPPQIRFIGLFDTVVSLGNPFREQEFMFLFDPKLPENVERAYHAMAIDLNRRAFGLDRIDASNGVTSEEVWFRGGHGDIGGNSTLKPGFGNSPNTEHPNLGSSNRSRSNLALQYMFRKAIKAGINLTSLNFDNYPIDPRAPIVINNTILDKKAGSRDRSRKPLREDIYHYSLFDGGTVIDSSQLQPSGYEDSQFSTRIVPLPGQRSELKIESD